MSVALLLSIAGSAGAANEVVLSPYAPFPRTALIDVGASFARPTHKQVVGAGISVSRAYAEALARVGKLSEGDKVTIRLGLFSDTIQRRPAALSYAVIFDGVVVPSYGPSSGRVDHELVVIVNAITGRYVEAFSYR